jgi:Ca2+-binding EF-hand superfamily protein
VRSSALCATLLLAPALALAAASGHNARLAEQFRRADADGNGMLSRAEAERGAPLLAKRFDAIDANRDGQISPEEIRASRRAARGWRGAKGGSRFEHYFARADSDADGVLSRAEAERGLPRVAKKFDRIDRDGDGRLSREELQAWLAARRAARPGK